MERDYKKDLRYENFFMFLSVGFALYNMVIGKWNISIFLWLYAFKCLYCIDYIKTIIKLGEKNEKINNN